MKDTPLADGLLGGIPKQVSEKDFSYVTELYKKKRKLIEARRRKEEMEDLQVEDDDVPQELDFEASPETIEDSESPEDMKAKVPSAVVLTREEEKKIFTIYRRVIDRAVYLYGIVETDKKKYKELIEGMGGSDKGQHHRDMLKRLDTILAGIPANLKSIEGLDVDQMRREAKSLERKRRLVEALLCETNMGLVKSMANKGYKPDSEAWYDFIQEGALGLLRAIELFDHKRNLKFSTFACNHIKVGITRWNKNNGKTIRIPVHMGETIVKIQRAIARLYAICGTRPTLEEIAEETGLDTKRLKKASQVPYAFSLGETEDRLSPMENLPKRERNPEEEIDNIHRYREMYEGLQLLNENQRNVIILRFGLDGQGSLTLQETANTITTNWNGKEKTMSRERVRQIQNEALKILAEHMARSKGEREEAIKEHLSIQRAKEAARAKRRARARKESAAERVKADAPPVMVQEGRKTMQMVDTIYHLLIKYGTVDDAIRNCERGELEALGFEVDWSGSGLLSLRRKDPALELQA